MAKVKMSYADHGRSARFELDGIDITSAIAGVRLDARGCDPCVIELELARVEALIEADADVILPVGTTQALMRLGWTPPVR